MKCIRYFLAALAWLVAGTVFANGTIVQLSGTLSVKRADGSTRILSMKSEVIPGDTLETQKDSYAQIKFDDGGSITLKPYAVHHRVLQLRRGQTAGGQPCVPPAQGRPAGGVGPDQQARQPGCLQDGHGHRHDRHSRHHLRCGRLQERNLQEGRRYAETTYRKRVFTSACVTGRSAWATAPARCCWPRDNSAS
jgi:hypothetical protein